MEVKINREIRDYTESMFFGLSLRQFLFSCFACAVAVLVFLTFKEKLGTETLSWVCMLSASPFVALGFVKYQGLTAEKLLWAWIKFEILTSKRLGVEQTNIYFEALKGTERRKDERKV